MRNGGWGGCRARNADAALRAGYVRAFTPPQSRRDGTWHELKVELVNRRGP
jgi:hypothetical protein